MTRIAYTVTLTAGEYAALQWLEARGYSANMIRLATETEDTVDGGTALKYRESAAWNVRDGAYNGDEIDHAFATCAAPELARKMFAFIDGIV